MEKKGYATLAKIRAVHGKDLKTDDYHELLRRTTVPDAAEYLKKNTHYADILSQIDTNTVHRGMLETLIRRNRFDQYKNLCNFEQLFSSNAEFYKYIIIDSEITEILSMIQFLNAESGESYISSMPSYLNQISTFDYIELAKVRDYGELLEFLKPTEYYPILKKFAPPTGFKVNFTALEVAMRTYYFNWVLAAAHKYINRKSSDAIEQKIKIQIDFVNIINAYRLKRFFGASGAEIEKNMLPFYGKLSKAKQMEIFSAEDDEEFIRRFSRTYYGRVMAEKGIDISDPEISIRKLRHHYARMALTQSVNTAVSLYAFMYLSEVEVSNIVSIIEGIRYKAEAKKIESLLVF